MPNHYLLESGAPDGYLNESGAGELLLEGDLNEAASNGGTLLSMPSLFVAATIIAAQLVMADPGMDLPIAAAPTLAADEGTWVAPYREPPPPQFFQAWEFEQHDRASPPLDESAYQPPAPWPATTSQPFVDSEEFRFTAPPPPFAGDDDGYSPPPAWRATADRTLWWADEFGPPQAAPTIRVTEDAYEPPRPWGQGYKIVPLPGRGGRVDQFQAGTIGVVEDQYAPPAPWPVPPQPLLWWPQDEWPTPPSPIITDDYGPSLSVRLVEPTVTLWLVDEAPPWNYEDEGWQPPQPWPAQFQSLGPRWPDEQWPTAAAALQVEPDPWPLPLPWASTAYQAILGHPDEQPTVPPPVGLDADPWFPPAPWVVPIHAPLLGWQDELASIVALAGDASSVEPVVRVWPTPLVQQPIVGEDEKILLVPIALETDELFPKVFVERIWVVPQPWQYEQHAIAFLSPHIPVMIRDRSGPRYIVDEQSGTRYRIDDDSTTRYEVEP